MYNLVKQYITNIRVVFPLIGPVYEFGSLQVQGQEGYADVRPLFADFQFTGCDIRHGPGVNRVLNVEDTLLPPESMGTILILDTLEHVENPHRAITECYRLLKPGGFFIITSVFNYPIHNHPVDYWRFTPQCFSLLLSPFCSMYVGFTGSPVLPYSIFGLGIKSPVNIEQLTSLSTKLKSLKIEKEIILTKP